MKPIACLTLSALALALSQVSPAVAADDPPVTAQEIMQRMKAAIEPARSSVRKIEFGLREEGGEEVQWLARQARKRVDGENRIAMVMLSPPSVAGTALLIAEKSSGPDVQWIYLPAIRRVRKIVPVGGLESFLGTDFTYSDLGFVNLHDREWKRLADEKRPSGDVAYRVEEDLNQNWYYGKIVDWIDSTTMLPLRRDFYSPGGDLWKREVFESVSEISGTPTPLIIRMEDLPAKSITEMRITSITYDTDLPSEIFSPDALPNLMSNPIWKKTDTQ